MSHLSARHGDAKRRRQQLQQERSLALIVKTGYPNDFQPTTKRDQTVPAGIYSARDTMLMFEDQRKHYTAEELADAVLSLSSCRRCEDRIQSVREKEIRLKKQQLAIEQERLERNQQSCQEASLLTAQRLRQRREKQRQQQEEEISSLIAQQSSSIEAMNIARMLSPRFREKFNFTPQISKHSTEEARIKELLSSTRVGSYYQ